MYEDILDDPEVQAIVEKYDSNHQNDVPLDEFGKPLEDNSDDDSDETPRISQTLMMTMMIRRR